MIDSEGFIKNDGQESSSEIRSNIQNKNLLQNKDDLYSNTGVISLGAEGKLLYQNGYLFADNVVNIPNDIARIDVKVRRGIQYSTSLIGWEKKIITRNSGQSAYPVNFLEDGENNMVTYQFVIILANYDRISLAPISFIKKKCFNNFTQINFTAGVNDDHAVYCPSCKYYYFNTVQNEMVLIPTFPSGSFNTIFQTYGFLYTRKLYAIYGYSEYLYGFLKINLDEDGIYGIYFQDTTSADTWEECQSWRSIEYTRIK